VNSITNSVHPYKIRVGPKTDNLSKLLPARGSWIKNDAGGPQSLYFNQVLHQAVPGNLLTVRGVRVTVMVIRKPSGTLAIMMPMKKMTASIQE